MKTWVSETRFPVEIHSKKYYIVIKYIFISYRVCYSNYTLFIIDLWFWEINTHLIHDFKTWLYTDTKTLFTISIIRFRQNIVDMMENIALVQELVVRLFEFETPTPKNTYSRFSYFEYWLKDTTYQQSY